MAISRERKQGIFTAFKDAVLSYEKSIIVDCTNVPSKSIALTRRVLKENGLKFMFGKNTYLRAALKDVDTPRANTMKKLLRGNIGVCFVQDNLGLAYDLLTSVTTPAAAKSGSIAPSDVTIEKRVTNIQPGQTSFFQSLQVPTKITKGNIEIISDVELIKAGDVVNSNQAALLKLLDITPFTYQFVPKFVNDDGEMFDASALSINAELMKEICEAEASKLTALSLATGQFNKASAPHALRKSYLDAIALCVSLGLTDDKIEAALAAGASSAPAASSADAPAAVEEEAAEDVDFDDLFD